MSPTTVCSHGLRVFLPVCVGLFLSAIAWAGTDANLIGQWPLVENAQDTSGNNHHGKLMNGAAVVDGVLNLDGVSAYVWFGNSKEFTPTGSLSYTLWISPAGGKPARINRVLGKIATPDQKEYCALLDAQQRLWVFLSGTGSEKADESVLRVTSEPLAVAPDKWTHIAVTWDSSLKADGIRVYVDGEEVLTQAASSGEIEKVHSGAADLCLGAFDIENTDVNGQQQQVVRNPFNGRISDFRLYSGVLAPNAVAALASLVPNSQTPTQNAQTAGTPATPAPSDADIPALFRGHLARAKPENDARFDDILAARQSVFRSIEKDLFSAPGKAKQVKAGDWKELIDNLAEDLSPAQKTRLAKKIRDAFCPDAKTLAALPAADAKLTVQAIWRLDPECARELLGALFANESLWTAMPVDEQALLARLSGEPWMGKVLEIHTERPGCDIEPVVFKKLDALWRAADAKQSLAVSVLEDIARAFSNASFFDEARYWGKKTYSTRIGAIDNLSDLTDLADFMFYTMLCTPNDDYPEYAAKLVAFLHARGTSPDPQEYRILGLPLVSKTARAAVKTAFFREDRQPNAALAQVLAWTSRELGEHRDFAALVDAQTAKNNRDSSSRWKLVQASLVGMRGDQPDPVRSYGALREMALRSAVPAALKQEAAAHLLSYLRHNKQSYVAVRFLKDAARADAGKYSGDSTLLNALTQEDKRQKEALDRERFWINQTSLRNRIDHYENLFSKAKAKGDTKAMDTYRNTVAELASGLADR